jgi:hypothetical protein
MNLSDSFSIGEKVEYGNIIGEIDYIDEKDEYVRISIPSIPGRDNARLIVYNCYCDKIKKIGE